MEKFLVSIFLFSALCSVVQNANILAIIPSPFFSHQTTFRPLWKELANRGHNVTLITTDLMDPTENITQIDLSGSYEVVEKYKLGSLVSQKGNTWKKLTTFLSLVDDIVTYQMSHPGLESIKSDTTYHCDVIVAEIIHPWFLALGKKLGCPTIGISSMDAFPITHSLMGNAIHPAMYAYVDVGFVKKLSFEERIRNTIYTGILFFAFNRVHTTFDPYVELHFGKGLPSIDELLGSLSLLIVNANPIFHPIRPSTPTTINIGGGVHLEQPKPLPKDLQDYLDQSKSGCIYFSFGSTVNSNYLTPEVIETFRKTFEDLAPLRVLWKFENESLANKPKNMEIRTWFPQQDILRHPNVKVFITQGGLQSMEEAIDSSVPMLGMPFYGDQINNVKKMVIKEFGVQLDVKTMDRETLKSSILELINNPKYKKNIERLSAITKDQPMRGLEKAVWWTEYVLRHGGTEHLRSPSADIPLYQYFFLDIIAFLIVALIFIILLFYYSFKLLRYVFRKLFKSKNKEKVN